MTLTRQGFITALEQQERTQVLYSSRYAGARNADMVIEKVLQDYLGMTDVHVTSHGLTTARTTDKPFPTWLQRVYTKLSTYTGEDITIRVVLVFTRNTRYRK